MVGPPLHRMNPSAPPSDPLSALTPDLLQQVRVALAESGREGCRAIDALCQVNVALRNACLQWQVWRDLCALRGYPAPPNPKVLASDAERREYWCKRFHAYCTGTAVNNVTIRAAVGLLQDAGGTVPADHPNGPIEGWYTEDCTDFTKLFDPNRDVVSMMERIPLNKFNHPLPWDVSNVTTLDGTFSRCRKFNQPLNWDTSRVTNMHGTFQDASQFNHPLHWDTSRVTTMQEMFSGASQFNQPLDWNVGRVTNMSGMFSNARSFNQKLRWDTRNVESMHSMFFEGENFNQKLFFDTRNVTTMNSMFDGARKFNKRLAWDTRNVRDMTEMFLHCARFDSPVVFDTRSVTRMSGMFGMCRKFSKAVNFDTGLVTNMNGMFYECRRFNNGGLPLRFNTSLVEDMGEMFSGADAFDQPLDDWNTSSVTKMDNMFSVTALEDRKALPQWYTAAVAARRAKNSYHYPYYV